MRSNIKIQNFVTYIVLILIGIVVFFIIGEEVPMVAKDTGVYTEISQTDGVMPIYPLFAYVCRKIFGEHYVYMAMVIIQGILAIVCTLYFTRFLQIECKLNSIMTVAVYILSLIPFLTYLPEANISHIILTEGLALPLSYLMIVYISKGYITNRLSWLFAALGVAAILYLIRSQLLIAILLVSGFIFIKLICSRHNPCAVIVEVFISGLMAIGTFTVCFVLFLGYLNIVVPVLEDKNKVVEETWFNKNIPQSTSSEVRDDETTEGDNSRIITSSSQFSRLVMNRGIYFLEDEDYTLYESVEKQQAFKVVIDSIRKNNAKGLYIDNPINWSKKWDEQGLVNERNVNYAIDGLSDYYRSLYPQYSDVEIWGLVKTDVIQFSVDALRLHPLKVLNLFVRLFFAGLQASIFFQPDGLFVASEIITCFLLVFSGVLLWVSRKNNENYVILFRITCASVLVYAFMISAIHYPLQRYLIYFQGMYYVTMSIMLLKGVENKRNGDCCNNSDFVF